MKKIFNIFLFVILNLNLVQSQNSDRTSAKKWNISADANLYLIPDNFVFLPVIRADKNHLHLEARYNYEDFNTFSAWLGYNVSGGKNLEYVLTPMLGGVVGNSNGIAAGLEIDLTFKKFNLWSESEYLYSVDDVDYNFIYNWTDITYSPKDWFWLGVSGQRTRLVETGLEINRGLLVGLAYKNFELSGYLYNLGFEQKYFLLTLSFTF